LFQVIYCLARNQIAASRVGAAGVTETASQRLLPAVGCIETAKPELFGHFTPLRVEET
jgi:hypothetical protein